MYCKKCNGYLEKGAKVCDRCGKKVSFEENDGNGKKKFLFVIIAIVVVILAVGIFIGYKLINSKNVQEPIDVSTILKKVDENSITFANYTFTLPDDLQYSNKDNYIYAASQNMDLSFKMNIIPASYDSLKDVAEDFIEAMQELGNQVISATFLERNGVEYFVFAIMQNDAKYLYALTSLNSSYVVQALIQSATDNGYETGLDYVNKIIKDYERLNAYIGVDKVGSFEDFLEVNSESETDIGSLFNPNIESAQ